MYAKGGHGFGMNKEVCRPTSGSNGLAIGSGKRVCLAQNDEAQDANTGQKSSPCLVTFELVPAAWPRLIRLSGLVKAPVAFHPLLQAGEGCRFLSPSQPNF